MEEKEKLFTVQEAADYLSVTYRAVLSWINDGEMDCYRIGDGRSIRIGMHHIQQYLKDREVTNPDNGATEDEAQKIDAAA